MAAITSNGQFSSGIEDSKRFQDDANRYYHSSC